MERRGPTASMMGACARAPCRLSIAAVERSCEERASLRVARDSRPFARLAACKRERDDERNARGQGATSRARCSNEPDLTGATQQSRQRRRPQMRLVEELARRRSRTVAGRSCRPPATPLRAAMARRSRSTAMTESTRQPRERVVHFGRERDEQQRHLDPLLPQVRARIARACPRWPGARASSRAKACVRTQILRCVPRGERAGCVFRHVRPRHAPVGQLGLLGILLALRRAPRDPAARRGAGTRTPRGGSTRATRARFSVRASRSRSGRAMATTGAPVRAQQCRALVRQRAPARDRIGSSRSTGRRPSPLGADAAVDVVQRVHREHVVEHAALHRRRSRTTQPGNAAAVQRLHAARAEHEHLARASAAAARASARWRGRRSWRSRSRWLPTRARERSPLPHRVVATSRAGSIHALKRDGQRRNGEQQPRARTAHQRPVATRRVGQASRAPHRARGRADALDATYAASAPAAQNWK